MRIFRKRLPLVFVIPVLIILVSIYLVQREINQDEWDTLISREFGYKIEYPTNWFGEVIKSGRGSDYLHGRINDNYLLPRSYLLIHSEFMENPTFKEGAVWGEEIIQRDCRYICWEEFQPTEVGAKSYLALNTTYREKASLGQTLHKEAVVIIADDRVYMLHFNTYNPSEEVEEIFARMLDSFEFFHYRTFLM